MALSLDLEQIMALAPDERAAKAGRGLANTSKWPSLGTNEQAAWGECSGSGKTPYQIKVDLTSLAYACSCPSRKLPCKHVLGLLIMLHDQPAAFKEHAAPPWVTEWQQRRAQRAQQRKEKQEAAPAKTADPEAQARRVRERHAKTLAGLKELELWLRDLVRQGLAAAQSRPPDFWEGPAKRMEDAQAPGVARLLRQLATLPASGEGWADRMLAHIGRLYLLVEGFKRLEALPAETQADIRATLGWPQSQDELLALPGVRDVWLVIGQHVQEDERLRAQITWLWGHTSQRGALLLEFAFGNAPLDKSLLPGTCIDAEMVFYPGSYPLRAQVKAQHAALASIDSLNGYASIDAALAAWADALARMPWLERFPLVLEQVVPVQHHGGWALRDAHNHLLPCAPQFAQSWRLLALSGGHPLLVAGEWNGSSLLPLGAFTEQGFKVL